MDTNTRKGFWEKYEPRLNGMPLTFEEFDLLCDEGRFGETQSSDSFFNEEATQ